MKVEIHFRKIDDIIIIDMSINYPIDLLKARNLRARGLGFRPRVVVINLTHRCNCKCEVCTLTSDWRIGVEPELELEGYRKLFSSPLLRGADLIRFTGGEPFLKKDLTRIVEAARDLARPRNLYLITNASNPEGLEKLIRTVVRPGVKFQVQVSLDAPFEEHEAYRGFPGLGEKIKETFERLAALRREIDFGAGINQTIFSTDPEPIIKVNEIINPYRIAHNLSTAVRFHESRMDIPPCMTEFPFEPCFDWTPEKIKPLFETIQRVIIEPQRREKSPPTQKLRNLMAKYLVEREQDFFLEGKSFPRLTCMALFTALRVDPYGGIIPCAVRKADVVGNIMESTLEEIWFGERAVKAREIVKQCYCWVECEVITNAVYSGAILPWLLKNTF